MIDQDLQDARETDQENYLENDPEDRRQIALGEHLGEDPDDLRLSSHTDHLYILGGSMRRSGSSPAYYQKLADEIREILSEHNYLENLWQQVIDLFIEEHEQLIQSKLESNIYKTDSRGALISEDRRRAFFLDMHGNKIGDVAYRTLSKLMPTNSQVDGGLSDLLGNLNDKLIAQVREIPDYEERRQMIETYIAKAKKDPHRYVNGLYFLLSGPSKHDHNTYHIDAIRSAFNGEEIQDTRPIYPINGGEYLVLTDSESDRAVTEYIRDSVELFMPGFLETETGIPEDAFIALSETGNNAGVLRIIEKTCGLESFVSSAVGSDGRGHFLAGYDSEETEILDDISGEYFYIYRTN